MRNECNLNNDKIKSYIRNDEKLTKIQKMFVMMKRRKTTFSMEQWVLVQFLFRWVYDFARFLCDWSMEYFFETKPRTKLSNK